MTDAPEFDLTDGGILRLNGEVVATVLPANDDPAEITAIQEAFAFTPAPTILDGHKIEVDEDVLLGLPLVTVDDGDHESVVIYAPHDMEVGTLAEILRARLATPEPHPLASDIQAAADAEPRWDGGHEQPYDAVEAGSPCDDLPGVVESLRSGARTGAYDTDDVLRAIELLEQARPPYEVHRDADGQVMAECRDEATAKTVAAGLCLLIGPEQPGYDLVG